MAVRHLKSQSGNQHSPGYSGIHIKKSHSGLLHKKLGIPQGEPIPESRLKSAENSSSASLRSEAQFADNSKGWKK